MFNISPPCLGVPPAASLQRRNVAPFASFLSIRLAKTKSTS
jgi:hypothetical protein